ncbi:MAG: adenylate/guanylate cyclase domain-containing protein [Anaerolineae bacterium]|nr:MAG: adenylate/guanylate cyclase domain-containing protein [Anaerolineae bacterium]
MAKEKLSPQQWWHGLLTGEAPPLPIRNFRHVWRMLPDGPRCKFCNAPYHGIGAPLMRLMGKGPSRLSPQLCRQCYDYASAVIGGAEVEVTLLFADVRGSTPLAERLGPSAFSVLISRFFAAAGEILIRHDALIDKLVGDQVAGMFIPGFAGPDHKRRAIEAARDLLRATGHGGTGDPWIPVGVGVHTGVAFIGAVGDASRATDITVLGDPPNVAARLSSSAAAGEILVSRAAMPLELQSAAIEQRSLDLKGKSAAVEVFVLAP